MKTSKFPEQNLVLKGKDDSVEDLPAWFGKDDLRNDVIITCFEVMPLEKVLILFFGKIYFRQYTTKEHFSPVCPEVDNPFQPFTEPIGTVVGNLIDRKVAQFMNEMDADESHPKEVLSTILNGFAIWLVQNITQIKEKNDDTQSDGKSS